MDVASRLKALRIASKLSTVKLAEITGLPQSVISKLENGNRRPDVDTLERVLNALGVSLAEFFSEEDQMLTPEIRQLCLKAQRLSPALQQALLHLVETIVQQSEKE